MTRRSSRHTLGLLIAASALTAAPRVHADTPKQGVLLGKNPSIWRPAPSGPVRVSREPSAVFMPTCGGGRLLWSSGDPGDVIYGVNLPTGPMFSSPAPNLLSINAGGNGGEIHPGAYKSPVYELPAESDDPENAIYIGGSGPMCVGGTTAEPRFTLNGSNFAYAGSPVPIVTASDGFEDTQTIRIGDTSVLSLHELDEWAPNPGSLITPCEPGPVLNSISPPVSHNEWPWIRRSSTCGFGWELNKAVTTFQPGGNYGFDGPTAYADPFDFATGGDPGKAWRRIYIRGGTFSGNPILRSDDGGESWTPGALTFNDWHPRMTSTPASTIDVIVAGIKGGFGGPNDPHGTLFYANCEGTAMNVYWSYDRGATLQGPVSPSAPCTGDAYKPTKAISRVAPYSEAFDTVRVAYPTKPNGGPARIAIGVVTVPRANVTIEGHVPSAVAGNRAVSFPTLDPLSSVERLQFIEPDTFEWSKTHGPGVPLPDTAVLAWEENDMRCAGTPPVPVTPTSLGAARYAVVNGEAKWTEAHGLAPDLLGTGAATWVGTASLGEHSCPPGAGNDYHEGSFFYRADPNDDRLNYLAMWLQTDGTAANPFLQEHYNIVSITPPVVPSMKGMTVGMAGTSGAFSLSADVEFSKPASFSDLNVSFVYQHEHGDWRKVEDGCVHPTVTLAASGRSATYSCVTHQGLKAQRFIAMVRPGDLVAPAHPPPSACAPNVRIFCQEENFFTSDLHCDAPTRAGISNVCTPTVFGPQCGLTESACASESDCCSGLTCSSGACARAPTCGETGGRCASDAECCSGFLCDGGTCAVPVCIGARCASSADCCHGLSCDAGVCTAPSCAGSGDDCFLPSDCCSGLTCVAGQPDSQSTCQRVCEPGTCDLGG